MNSPRNQSSIEPTGSEIYHFYFKRTLVADAHKCLCGSVLKFKISKGYSPGVNHVKSLHKNWLQLMKEKNNHGAIENYVSVVKEKAKDIYGWIDLIISHNLPLSYVEGVKARLYSKLGPISRNTLSKFMGKITDHIVTELTKELKGKMLGLLFDGWSENGLHVVAIFVSYEGPSHKAVLRLLAVAPLLNEAVFTADEHIRFMISTLQLYDLSLADISFICGDNCSTNKSIAIKTKKLFFGCNSHRFNIAVNSILLQNSNAEILSSIEKLMIKLKTLKCSARLKQCYSYNFICICCSVFYFDICISLLSVIPDYV